MRVDCIRIGSLRLIQALMLGLLIVPGYMVAPILFSQAPTTTMAGAFAGSIFHAANLGLMLLGAAHIVFWLRMRSGGFVIGRLRWGLLAAMLALVVTNEYAVSPILADLKSQVGMMELMPEQSPIRQQFGMWHGVSSAIHLVTSLVALLLVALGPGKDATH